RIADVAVHRETRLGVREDVLLSIEVIIVQERPIVQLIERIHMIELACDGETVDPSAVVDQRDHLVARSIEKEHVLQAVAVKVQPSHLDEVGATGPGQIKLLPLIVHRYCSIKEQWPGCLCAGLGSEQCGKDQYGSKVHGMLAVEVQSWRSIVPFTGPSTLK